MPRFFDGRLPDLNLGTANGASCDAGLAERLLQIANTSPLSAVLNGRFKGGHITRQYGQPAQGIHAAQSCYMDEHWPFEYRPALAAQVQPVLRQLLEAVLAFVEG